MNLSNQVLKLPEHEIDLDLRGELKWTRNSDLAVVRPRFLTSLKSVDYYPSQNETQTKTKLDLMDAFYEHYWNSEFSTTAGLQVYQWGPAEFMNASNPLFHFNPQQKSVINKDKGQALVRFNYSPDKNNSAVLAIEPVSNNEPEWMAEDRFVMKAVLKFERNWSDSANYLGLVMGSQEKSNFFVGEYGSYSPLDGLSFYADVKHSQNSENFEPVFNGTAYNLLPVESNSGNWPVLSVLGVRWEDKYDIRFEYIYNSAGFDLQALASAIAAAANPVSPQYLQNLRRFQRLGLELPGKNYVYLSYRVADPFKFKELNLYARYFRSMQDDSALAQFEFDKSFFDSLLVFSSFSYVSGELDTEFRLLNDWQFLAGVKWAL